MEEKLYKVSATNDDQYSLGFDSFVCTEKALKDYKKKIKAWVEREGLEDVIIKRNKIIFQSFGQIELTWEPHKIDVITKFGELRELAWSSCGYDDTFLCIDIKAIDD